MKRRRKRKRQARKRKKMTDIEVKYLGTAYKGSGTTKLSELEVGASITANKA